jgi:lipid II:glycine glycyltransferase (peptidoglycan interpeptide bridge formation enzyme)
MLKILCKEKHMKLMQFQSMHVWFADDAYDCQAKCDLIRYYGSKSLHDNSLASLLQKTIVIDLTRSTEEIFADFKRQHKQQIRKSELDSQETNFLDSESILKSGEVLDDFARMYRSMYQEKGINKDLDIEILREYANNGVLWISSVSYGGKPIIYHSLISDRKSVRAMQSCSVFRTQDQPMQQLTGRANKKLHWDEMQYFKQLGATSYDFGGIFSYDAQDDGINQFKLGFGGEHDEYYKEVIARSLRAKLYYMICKRLNKNII